VPGDRTLEMTLTRSEVLDARNSENGSSPHVEVRPCEHCGAPLKASQARACSQRCALRLGRAAIEAKRPTTNKRPKTKPAASRAPSSPESTSLLDFLARLPLEVHAVEIDGWRCTRLP
jgi:hypothetical protein